MTTYKHPVSPDRADWRRGTEITDETDFAIIDAWSKGALPLRTDSGLHFPSCHARFYATGHEIRAGIKFGRLKIDRVLRTFTCRDKADFSGFVMPRYAERLLYKASGNKMMEEFIKLELNSTYGKFAINPRNFKKWIFVPDEDRGLYQTGQIVDDMGRHHLAIWHNGEVYTCDQIPANGAAYRFSRPAENPTGFRNVATAASITGAARAELFTGLCQSIDPLYCDTDAIAAATMKDVRFGSKDLGAWKLEAEADEMLIGGKKLYAMLGEPPADPDMVAARIERYGDPRCVKLACKGGRLNVAQLRQIAMGETVTFYPEMPTFRFDGSQFYQDRTFKITNPHLVSRFPDELTRGDINGGLQRLILEV